MGSARDPAELIEQDNIGWCAVWIIGVVLCWWLPFFVPANEEGTVRRGSTFLHPSLLLLVTCTVTIDKIK